MAAQPFDIGVVGHFSVDTINLPSRTKPFVVLGGAATYTSFIAKRLEATVAVISKVGGNFPQAYMWWIKEEGINVSGVSAVIDKPTTCFELTYAKGLSERTLRLKKQRTSHNC
jgi:sugar/nucleoside kinase (ribokinase family)